MTLRIELLGGIDRLNATTAVLQRARLADGFGGVWEAADVQWWWRRPRPTDDLRLPVWFDGFGPAAAVGLTAWGPSWQADVFAVPNIVDIGAVWSSLLDIADTHEAEELEVLVREDDERLMGLVTGSGFHANDDTSGITWMAADERPPVSAPPDGFTIVDRTMGPDRPHPMIARNGDHVEARLAQCSLYDPRLDLSVEAPDGTLAGYALFWLDHITGVGMLEPMRVEVAYQRRGLARALLTVGIDRLATMGARRLKVGFNGDAGRTLYVGAGFVEAATLRAFKRSSNGES